MDPVSVEHQDTLASDALRPRAIPSTDAPPRPQMLTAPTEREPVDAEPSHSAPTQSVLSSTAAIQLSSSAAAAPRDRLSSMSPELLSHIFALSRYREPITGPLLPYTRANLYRDVYVWEVEKLQAFCDTIAMDPRLGALVRRCRLQVNQQPRMPTRLAMVALYQSLKNLDRLDVCGHQSDWILSHDVASSCFPRLRELRLDSSYFFDDPRDCLNPSRFACLEHYSQLEVLAVSALSDKDYLKDFYGSESEEEEEVSEGELQEEAGIDGERGREGKWRGGMTAEGDDTRAVQQTVVDQSALVACTICRTAGPRLDPSTASADAGDPVFSSINELVCHTRIDAPCTLPFIEHFQNLTRLSLSDYQIQGDRSFAPFLSVYNRASSIKHLKLTADDEMVFVGAMDDILVGLERFTALDSLDLDLRACGSASVQFLPDPLPLNHLTLQINNENLSSASLTALLRPGPSRLSSLKTLTLDGIDAATGTRIEEAGPWYDSWSIIPEPHPDWILPLDRSGTLKLKDAEDLVKLAKENGVEVKGAVLVAIKVQRAWNHDVRLAASWEDDHRGGPAVLPRDTDHLRRRDRFFFLSSSEMRHMDPWCRM
jgi:hypothetical protein